MKIRTLGYMVKEGFKNLWRNRMMSFASIGSVTATLIILGLIFILILNISSFAEGAKDQFDSIQVYLMEDITKERIEEIGNEIRAIENIKDVQFESKDDALNKMKEMFGEHGYLLQDIDDPLPNSYIVYVENIEDSKAVVEKIEVIEDIVLFLFIDLLSIFNLIFLTIYVP